ncbi:MAG: SUMF1/EgtB/PvdO family nonheme iron enzyme [Paludibacteraceae bacterium]|nr:SUMF1/EgtB/PvdO family nonheme iron enzyme [Paludibacteraceae bacterium]MBQ1851614.1 SUMF1/EgtB/PvdO family nonheme iron enzyme [Paludibacteraceae bacterium]MBQ2064988.1 SUMF1/EgtB/PvdO family nonheme iron enzyme [Paludibacteraceae bacterium]
MKTRKSFIYAAGLVALMSVFCASCKKEQPVVYTVTLDKATSEIMVGETFEINAVITPAVEAEYVTFTVDNPAIASFEATENKAVVKGEGGGVATITATYKGGSATCSVTVITQNGYEKRWPETLTTTMGKFIKIQKDTLGVYKMGSESGRENEKPMHNVTFTKSYYMAEFEVTQKQWQSIMGSNPSADKGDDLPVNNVSYSDVFAFIKKLNEATGREFRLPTEAEWEYAARGGEKSKGYIYSGGNDINAVAWYDDNEGVLPHSAINSGKAANELGLYNMSGNIMEWCSDKMRTYTTEPVVDPVGAVGSKYAVRGGGFDSSDAECTSTYRNWFASASKFYNLGFRLVLSHPLDSELKD